MTNTKLKLFEAIFFKFKICLEKKTLNENNVAVAEMKQLIAVSQKNKQNRMLCSILQFTGNFTSKNLLENINF